MDPQLKKGLLDVCVLKALEKEDSYGYQIIKDLAQVIEVSESTLYPVLKRLENLEEVEVYHVEHNSRLRKYYKILPSGRRHIDEFLNDWQEVNRVFDYINGRE